MDGAEGEIISMIEKISRQGVVRSTESAYRYDWSNYPGGKAILLTSGGIAVLGSLGEDKRGYIGWAPLPDRDREKEKELGIT